MLTESFGGHCPVCGYDKLFLRYGSSPHNGYYEHDACPNCSFAYGSDTHTQQSKGKSVWDGLLEYYLAELEDKGFPLDVGGLRQFVEGLNPDHRDTAIVETVFAYEDGETEDPEYFLFSKEEVEKITRVKNDRQREV